MPGCCGDGPDHQTDDPVWRKVVWVALAANGLMFVLDIVLSKQSLSVSVLADSLDFLGDTFTYGMTLAVITGSALSRSRAALAKGLLFLGLAGFAVWRAVSGFYAPPSPKGEIMFFAGVLGLIVNVSVAVLMFRFRDGDANRRSVWLCSRNDAIGNIAVMLAAGGVMGLGRAWPDLITGLGLAGLGLWTGVAVIRQSLEEMKPGARGITGL